jgi:hypothetical protein
MVKKVSKKGGVNKRHWGISVLSILVWINSFFALFAGLFLVFGSVAVGPIIEKWAPEYIWLTNAGIAALIFLGIFFIACSVLNFFIGKGLWIGQNWARIFILVITGLGALISLLSLEIGGIIINGVIIWYLGFYKPTVNWFKK